MTETLEDRTAQSIRIAVVVPCFNDGATLPETIRSVQAQEPAELVVVDDGSDDPATLETLAALAADGVRVVRQENQGLAAARMAGVRATSAPYVFALDADDVLLPGALTDLADSLDARPEAAAAWGDTRFFGDVEREVETAREIDAWRITFVNDLPAASLFRRDALEAVGGWKLRGGYEDWELWMSLAERGLSGVHVGRATTGYRVHGRRMWGEATARHDEILAELRRRHPALFQNRARNRRASASGTVAKLVLSTVDQLPVSSRGRRALSNLAVRPRSTAGLAVANRVNGRSSRSGPPREEVVVVGAGPYGLSAAAHLRHAGISTRVFGNAMESWESHMPAGMLLRSRWEASQIADPERRLSLERFHAEHGLEPQKPIPLERFVDYGRWFQRHAVPDLDTRRVERVARENGHFRVHLADGDSVRAARVVVATGIVSYAWRPPEFDSLPESVVSHAADHSDLRRFSGRSVVVVGAGQSALESAALLGEAGAQVTVLVRRPEVEWLNELEADGALQRLSLYAYRRIGVGGPRSSWVAAMPPLFQQLSRQRQETVTLRCIRPAGAAWLMPRLGGVEIVTDAVVSGARHAGSGVVVELEGGRKAEAEHVLLATGYRVDVRRSPALDAELAGSLEVDAGYPVLRPGLESSVPGLHFVGAPAMATLGPVMRFVCGTWFSSRALTHRFTSGRTKRAVCSW